MIQALPETDSLTLSDAADVQRAKSAMTPSPPKKRPR